VLPFVNMSGNPSNDYFSDGLAETTLDMLAQVPDLKVIARTSSFQFRGKTSDMRQIGRTLGAAHLLEGSVQQAGDTLRITVQLIRAEDGSHLWSRRYDRKLKDLFSIQDEIATSVVDALALKLPDSTQRRLVQKRTDNVAAYDAYLKGMALLPRRDVAQMEQALRHFEHAIELDPQYARAYVGAHDAIHLLNLYGSVDEATKRRADLYLTRALALAPSSGEAHIARAVALENAGKQDEAMAEYRRGVQLAPGYATGWQWMGELEGAGFGRFDTGLAMLAKARELDPLSTVIRSTWLFHLGQADHVDQALAGMDALIAEHPEVARSYDDRAAIHQVNGDLVSALQDFAEQGRRDPKAYGFRAHRCAALMDFGALDAAQACLRPLAAQAPDAMMLRATQARLAWLQGDTDSAWHFLPDDTHSSLGYYRAAAMVRRNDSAGALALLRAMKPQLIDGKRPPAPGEAFESVNAGIALLRTGQTARGRVLIEQALAAVKVRPYAAVLAGRGWIEVLGLSALGRKDAALAALKAGVDAGYDQQIDDLQVDPLLADVRTDPRFAAILAPARASAAAKVDAARRAGLL
jgi:TolB-like protein/Flp pilus assembly protein TadD